MATKEFLRKLRQKHHLGEYRLKRGKKAKTIKIRRAKGSHKRVKRRVFHMARRKKHSFGGRKSGIMGGLYKPTGFIAAMLLGAGAATLSEKVLPQMIPYQNAAVGFVVGGVGGAAGALAKDMLKMSVGSGSTGTYGTW